MCTFSTVMDGNISCMQYVDNILCRIVLRMILNKTSYDSDNHFDRTLYLRLQSIDKIMFAN